MFVLSKRQRRAATCRPCRRAQRFRRPEHACYGAVLGESQLDRTTWVACGCECQRTLTTMGFFDLEGAPPVEHAPTPVVEAHERGLDPGSPASR